MDQAIRSGVVSVMDGLTPCLSSEDPGSPSSRRVGWERVVLGCARPSFILHPHSGAGAPALHLEQPRGPEALLFRSEASSGS